MIKASSARRHSKAAARATSHLPPHSRPPSRLPQCQLGTHSPGTHTVNAKALLHGSQREREWWYIKKKRLNDKQIIVRSGQDRTGSDCWLISRTQDSEAAVSGPCPASSLPSTRAHTHTYTHTHTHTHTYIYTPHGSVVRILHVLTTMNVWVTCSLLLILSSSSSSHLPTPLLLLPRVLLRKKSRTEWVGTRD